MTPRVRPIEILLVEDSATDILMAREALAEAKVLNHLSVTENGEEALRFLHKQEPFADASRPDLVLLDLNLPRRSGQEVLDEIKTDEELRRIPVVVLTTSRADQDVLETYGLHANCYISKPLDFGKFTEVVRSIEQFWLCVVTLPPNPG
jgi:two-component system, chemotaxis family, response regulator Rcp1